MIKNLFLSVGAMKAGTTWLYEQLFDHPEISFLPEKEIHYFVSVTTDRWTLIDRNERLKRSFARIAGITFDKYRESIDTISWYTNYARPVKINDEWYQSLFKDAKSKYCADFCNLNSGLDEHGWKRVRQNFSDNLKVIYCLRDPFKRAWSHYKFHLEWTGQEELILSDGVEGFKKLLANNWFQEIVGYDVVIKNLRKNLQANELALFYFEDFRKEPEKTLNDICHFLEISPVKKNNKDLTKKVNASSDLKIPANYSEYLWEYLAPLYKNLEEMNLIHPAWLPFGTMPVDKSKDTTSRTAASSAANNEQQARQSRTKKSSSKHRKFKAHR